MKKKIFFIAAFFALCVILFYRSQKKEFPSLDHLYGRWQVVKIAPKHGAVPEDVGKIIEFHPKYFIENGAQYNEVRYIYDIVPHVYMDDDAEEYFGYINRENECLDVEIGRFKDNVYRDSYDKKFILESSGKLIGGIYSDILLERITPRPWWQRAISYLRAIFSFEYNPKKVVPKEMWGNWEVVSIHEKSYIYSKKDQQYANEVLGTTFFINPKYLIINSDQYNNPIYFYNQGMADCLNITRFSLDNYNMYVINNSIAAYVNFYFDDNGTLCFEHDCIDFICRRIEDPSLWKRIKYYFNWLIGKDCSGRGFLNQCLRGRKISNAKRLLKGSTPLDTKKLQKSYNNLVNKIIPEVANKFSKTQLENLNYIILLIQDSEELIKVLQELRTDYEKIATREWRLKFFQSLLVLFRFDYDDEFFVFTELMKKAEAFLIKPITEEELREIEKYVIKKNDLYRKFSITRVCENENGEPYYRIVYNKSYYSHGDDEYSN